MNVIEFAEKRLNDSEANNNWVDARYWAAYIDGAKAQKKEMNSKNCSTCKWRDTFTQACCNGNSEYRADFVSDDDSCRLWEEDANGTPEN